MASRSKMEMDHAAQASFQNLRWREHSQQMRLVLTLLALLLLTSKTDGPLSWAAGLSFPNGGFESSPEGGPNDWVWPDTDWVWDESVAHSGARSARVRRDIGDETAALWSAYVSVHPSTVYTLTYWLRTQEATWYPRVGIYQYSSAKARTGLDLSAYANIESGTNDWMPVVYRFQTMPDADTIRVRLYLETDTTGVFWFDDFDLDQGPRARYPFQDGFPVMASGWVYYSSPAVADIDDDGDRELLVGGGYAVSGWDDTGVELNAFPLGIDGGLIGSQLALADLDGDGDLEIAAGTRTPVADGQGLVFVWHHTGALLGGWPQRVAWNVEYGADASLVSSVALADIDGDDDLEVLAGTTNNATYYSGSDLPATLDLYAWHADGTLVVGWPAAHGIAGIYGAIAAGDLTGDGVANVIVGRDHRYLNAYAADGSSLPGWPIQTYLDRNGDRDDYHEIPRLVYPFGAPIIADLDVDGVAEYIAAGDVMGPGNDLTLHSSGVLILEPNGARWPGWETAAVGEGVLSQGDLPLQAPVVADLDNDGQLEIIAATHDGWIRAYKTDRTLLWAFNYTQGATLCASEPVVGDVDGDGRSEIIFGTHVPLQTDSDRDGPVGLWGLEADGAVMPGFPLPISTPGVRAAPTLADLDGDGDLEIVVATVVGQVFVWDTSTPVVPCQLPWPTGRHDVRRSGSYVRLGTDFDLTHKVAAMPVAQQGETVTFTIHLHAVGDGLPITYAIHLTDTIPAGVSYVPGTLAATLGSVTDTEEALYWSGVLSSTPTVDVTYAVTVTTGETRIISNTAIIDTAVQGLITRTGRIYANGFSVYLPLIKRQF